MYVFSQQIYKDIETEHAFRNKMHNLTGEIYTLARKEKEKSLRQGGANTIMVYVLLTKYLMCLSSLEAERDEMGQHRIGVSQHTLTNALEKPRDLLFCLGQICPCP